MCGRHYVGRDIRETLSEVMCKVGGGMQGRALHAEEAAKIIPPHQDTFSLFK